MRHTPSNQAHVKLDKEHSSAEARFVLVRAGELTGRVVDAETGKPIANLRVYPITLLYAHGRPTQIGHKPAVTDSEGQFVATGLQPGRSSWTRPSGVVVQTTCAVASTSER